MKEWFFNNTPLIAVMTAAFFPLILIILKWLMDKIEEYSKRRKNNDNKK
ncbi:MAG: hypothetical protein IKB70_03620 [Bacilli bacterium]|nr:hypothetical protein [Bacilli bacterium]